MSGAKVCHICGIPRDKPGLGYCSAAHDRHTEGTTMKKPMKGGAYLDWSAEGPGGITLRERLRRLIEVDGLSMTDAARRLGISPTQAKGAKQRYGVKNGRSGGKGRTRQDLSMLIEADRASTAEERIAIGRRHGLTHDAVRMAVIRWRRLGRPGLVVTGGG